MKSLKEVYPTFTVTAMTAALAISPPPPIGPTHVAVNDAAAAVHGDAFGCVHPHDRDGGQER